MLALAESFQADPSADWAFDAMSGLLVTAQQTSVDSWQKSFVIFHSYVKYCFE